MQELTLVLRENGKELETVIKETNTEPSHLIQSLEEFIQSTNSLLTKWIENMGDSGEVMETDEDEESDGDEEKDENEVPISPKKFKK